MNEAKHGKKTISLQIQLNVIPIEDENKLSFGNGTIRLEPNSLLGIESEYTSDLKSLEELPTQIENILKYVGIELWEA